MTDNEAMDRLKSGDRSALGIVYERHKVSLYTYAFHQLKDRFAAEDLVQNTFFKILKYADRYKADSNFKGWMYTIARNLVKDQYRKNSSMYAVKAKISETIRPASLVEDASHQLEKKEDKDLLMKILDTLDRDKREVLVLIKLHGMRYKEVAELLGMKEGYLRILVFRSLRELQLKCADYKKQTQY